MLYLAQVNKNTLSDELKLELLAYQKTDNIWMFCNSEFLSVDQESSFNDGMLVLVELDKQRQIIEIKQAKDWILNIVQEFLSSDSVTSEFIQQEQAKVEKWRQEITAQSQDITRLRLEIESRREELQALEHSLKLEQDKIKSKSYNS